MATSQQEEGSSAKRVSPLVLVLFVFFLFTAAGLLVLASLVSSAVSQKQQVVGNRDNDGQRLLLEENGGLPESAIPLESVNIELVSSDNPDNSANAELNFAKGQIVIVTVLMKNPKDQSIESASITNGTCSQPGESTLVGQRNETEAATFSFNTLEKDLFSEDYSLQIQTSGGILLCGAIE